MVEELFGNSRQNIETVFILNKNQYSFKKYVGENVVIPLKKLGVTSIGTRFQTVASFENATGKAPTKAQLKPHIDELLEHCDLQGIKRIVCMNAPYFSYLTNRKFEASIGTVTNCIISDFEHIEVLPMVNPAVVSKTPGKAGLARKAMQTIAEVILGTYTEESFKFDNYELVFDPKRAQELLESIKDQERVAWDIETTGLHHMTSEIITHAFAKDELNAFTIVTHSKYLGKDKAKLMDEVVGKFLTSFKGSLLIHNIGFEGKFLAKKYWMKDWDDQQGIVDCFKHTKWDDSMLLNYALLNSTERTPLGLKDLAMDKYGDWDKGIDVKNALETPIDKLAYYNAVDVSATWHVWNRARNAISPEQFGFYDNTMRKTQILFLKLMLTGLPIDMPNVISAKNELTELLEESEKIFYNNPLVIMTEQEIHFKLSKKYNETHKTTSKTPEDFSEIRLNFNSSNQLRILLYDVMDYDPIEFTETDQPKTNRASIEEFLVTETDPDKREVLEALIAFSQISIILTTFLKSFENDSIEVAPNTYRLYGNLRNGGTQTYRPTANNPNLLNMPSGSKYGKLIKKCLKAREGYIIGSSDHASLQGRTGANLTKDANLIRLYNEDLDMHSVHATRFWPEEFPDFEDTFEYYESVKANYPEIRNKSKPGTFLMQFGGGVSKLAKTLKIPVPEAEKIHTAYHHDLYPGMAEYNDGVGETAIRQGYVELGLGLRLQCPSVYSKDDGTKASALRSVANATVQFWDVLTLIGIEKFQAEIEKQGYVQKVIMHSTIYDSVYMEIETVPETIKWVNDTLISCMIEDYMENQPVKLVANLDITQTKGTWADLLELPNNCPIETIVDALSIDRTNKDSIKAYQDKWH